MKTIARLLGALGLCLASSVLSRAQTPLPFDGFEGYSNGNLHGQGGWTVTNLAGGSQAWVGSSYVLSGLKSMYLLDDDSANNPKAWREPTGTNLTHGRFDFAVLESTLTSGRDYWTVSFSNVGSSTANFKLALISATTLALYGGSGGSTSLATVAISSTSYDPAAWNTFSLVFNESTNTAAVYLNGGATPVLSATHAATNWSAGRYTCSPGNSTFTGMAVFFDESLPEWEYTEKLRYAPPTLVAPTVWAPTAGFNSRTFATDEDVIVQLSPTVTRTGNLGVVSGRGVRLIGGDLGTTYLAATAQTKSLFIEGIKADHSAGLPVVNGVPVELVATRGAGSKEKDGMMITGTTTGTGASVYLQNSSIRGVHGTANAHGAAVAISSIVLNSVTPHPTLPNQGTYNVTINTSAPMTLPAGTNWVIVGATNQPKLAGTYKIILSSATTASSFTGDRWDTWNPLPASPFSAGLTGTGGYVWPNDPSISPLHADAYQSMAEGMYEIAYFYRVTMDSNAECFLGMNQLNTQGMRNLVMTRVNMSVNSIYPQNYDSASIYLGTTTETGGGWGTNGFPVTLDRVYIKPRAGRGVVQAVWPGAGSTRGGVPVGALSDDGGATAYWPAALGVTGVVTKSTHVNGYPLEPGYTNRDYASLSGSNTPGLNYVSPGYSSDAVQPLAMSTITGAPALTTINVASSSAVGTLVTRLDVNFTGAGHIIDLALTDPSGRFGIDANNKRNVVVKTALASGSYPVTAVATQQGNTSNQITKNFTIVVP